MKRDDPYNDFKTYHKAAHISPQGQVSALCFKRPRAISKRQTWTTDDRAVTCKKCQRKLAETTPAHG